MMRRLLELLFLQSYNVNCQYLTSFLKRLLKTAEMVPHFKTIQSVKISELRGSVSMHKLDC